MSPIKILQNAEVTLFKSEGFETFVSSHWLTATQKSVAAVGAALIIFQRVFNSVIGSWWEEKSLLLVSENGSPCVSAVPAGSLICMDVGQWCRGLAEDPRA